MEDRRLAASRKPDAVELLSTIKPKCTFLPKTRQYEVARLSYWAYEQRQSEPSCIFQPLDAADVALAVVILRQTGTPFAVKSGGHGRTLGESSITGGVLIDLKRLNHVNVASDRKTVDIGPGNTWMEVYSSLEPVGLSVVGGRASSVGVGGFLLGGGISYNSNRYGWALDNVEGYQIVLSNGTIVNADAENHADLYKALRGGVANFGIVTSCKLTTIPAQRWWGGGVGLDIPHRADVIDKFFEYGDDNVANKNMSMIMAFNHSPGHGWIIGADLMYLEPQRPADVPIFGDILKLPVLADDTKVASQITHIAEMAKAFPDNLHNCYWTFCTKPDKRIVEFYGRTWMEEAAGLLDIAGIDGNMIADCQFVTQNIVDAMSRRGGNALGLQGKGPLLMMLIQPNWADGSQSQRVYKSVARTVAKVRAEAARLGVSHDYVYCNYASPWQDPYSGYGVEAKEFLRQTAIKYDPQGMFQRQRKSGFSLSGALRAEKL